MLQRLQTRKRGKVLKKLADTLDFVYFGRLSRDDEHLPVYGISATLSHVDAHYVVGDYEDYSVRLLDRLDHHKDSSQTVHHYQLIVEVSLKSHTCHNPALLLANGYEHVYLEKVKLLQKYHMLNLEADEKYYGEFLSRYKIFGQSYALEISDDWLSMEVQKVLATHAWPFSFEIDDKNKLYVYATYADLKLKDAEKALKLAVWLAQVIDAE